MSWPSRIYCKVVGCPEGNTAIVEVIGSPGVTSDSFHPHPCVRIDADLIPTHKRFPNSLVWFDIEGGKYVYVEPVVEGELQ